MKASDITDQALLDAVVLACAIRQHASATRWDVASILAGHPGVVGTAEATQDWPDILPKVLLAKAKRLIRRGLIVGCPCGCRGDFEVTPTVTDRATELRRAGVGWDEAWECAQRELWARAEGAFGRTT